jgi:hypothetical protein
MAILLATAALAALVVERTGSSDGDRPETLPSGEAVATAPAPSIYVPEGFDESSAPGALPLFDDVSETTGVAGDTAAAEVTRVEVPPGPDGEAQLARAGMLTRLWATQRYLVSGQAWGDFDRDGLVDLYVTDQTGPNRLLRNDGAGGFEEASSAADVALADHVSGGATWVDFDNDGWVDLHVLGEGPDHLFRNEAGGGFTDVTEEAGVSDPGKGQTAAWGDFDGDGDLDVYVVDYGCQPCRIDGSMTMDAFEQSHFFVNQGDGTFRDATDVMREFRGTSGFGFSAAWLDYDDDGDQDLYVVNDVHYGGNYDFEYGPEGDSLEEMAEIAGERLTPGNLLLRNDGAGCDGWCFTDVSEPSGAGVRADAMGLAVGDVDGDGDEDLFFSNGGYRAGPTVFLRNNGDGTFTDESLAVGANVGEWSWGTSFLDADLDGRLDAVLAVGWSELLYQAQARALTDDDYRDAERSRAAVLFGDTPLDPTATLPSAVPWPVVDDGHARTDNLRVLLQRADGTFAVTLLGRTDVVAPSHYGTAVADYDNDGWPDVVVGKMSDGFALLRNRGELGAGNHRLVVDVQGDGSAVSTDAVGTRVTVVADDGSRQLRVVRIGSSLGSGEDRRLLFGLGTASVARLVVEWPDGTRDEFTAPLTDQLVQITYPGELATTALEERRE